MAAHQVDVVIPHFRGSERLLKCLETVYKTTYDDFRVLLVDNGSSDGSCEEAERRFPQLEIIRLKENLGFAGGCNTGVRESDRELVALLNDDTEVEPDWLDNLVETLLADEKTAVVQPKLHWIKDRKRFDYAGGVGGLIDVFGYPFCFGRIFETKEIDNGQYDWVRDIFWASGSACLFRRELYLAAGGLDENFFAHQEEIDLNWRLQLMGYNIKAAPASVVYHYGGGTLSEASFRKKYLNHRNSIMMLLKNYEFKTLLWVLPIRLTLEAAAMVLAVKQRDIKRIGAIIGAVIWNSFNLPTLLKERKRIKSIRRRPDSEITKRMYTGTAALQYYLFSKRTYYQLVQAREKVPLAEGKIHSKLNGWSG